MGITAKELARKLNLSAAAVSMALNHKPGVSTATRQLVLDAAEKYGYDFSRIAEKHTTSGAIYFVIYKKHGTVVADTPFFSQVSEGISQGCKKNDYRLKISYIYEDEDTITKQIEEIQYSDCAGIILLGTEMEAGDLKPFLNLPIPVVLLDAYFETVPCNCVLINNVQGAYLAARHLIRTCKTQPGYLRSAYQISNFAERSSGFYKAVRAAGMSSSRSIVHSLTPSMEGAYTDMLELIKNGEELASSTTIQRETKLFLGADNEETAELTVPMYDFGDWASRMKAYRKKNHITQQELAQLMGVKHFTLRSWEQKQAKPPYNVWRLHKHLFDDSIKLT